MHSTAHHTAIESSITYTPNLPKTRGGSKGRPMQTPLYSASPNAFTSTTTVLPKLEVEALTATAFADFGDVIEAAAAGRAESMNDGSALRFPALAMIDCQAEGGTPVISQCRAEARALPFAISLLERHPLGSQAFIPLRPMRYLVVVASDPGCRPRAFLATAGQGVNFHRGTWHHPLLALEPSSDFLIIERVGPGTNCETLALSQTYCIEPLLV